MSRTKEFEVEDVLEKAMMVFWQKGYENSSMQDLLKAMGLNKGSLYASFHDKETLFKRTLDYYDQNRRKKMILTGQPLNDIHNFMKSLVARSSKSNEGVRGCLIFNTSMDLDGQDQAFRDEISAKVRWTEDFFYKALCEAKRLEQVRQDLDCRVVAQILFGAVFSIIGVAKSCQDKTLLDNISKGALAHLK